MPLSAIVLIAGCGDDGAGPEEEQLHREDVVGTFDVVEINGLPVPAALPGGDDTLVSGFTELRFDGTAHQEVVILQGREGLDPLRVELGGDFTWSFTPADSSFSTTTPDETGALVTRTIGKFLSADSLRTEVPFEPAPGGVQVEVWVRRP
jgi:hypothetical protein